MGQRSERVAQCLRGLGETETFCASHREPAAGLFLEVEGVGRLPLPLTSAQIEALVAVASPSPFGYRDETRHDASVRDSVEIAGDRVQLDDRVWGPRFGRALDEIRAGLGFPAGAEVEVEPHKLVLYGEGQFFAPHRDTESDPTVWATLVVMLPTDYRGGELVVSHAGKRVTYEAAGARYLSFVGFYTDCLHETKPVREGHRVALTFRLRVTSTEARPTIGDGEHARLVHEVERFFQDEDEEEAPWLVYLLDHHYAEQSLGWSRLKSTDRARVEALRQVAERAGCDCYLAIADVEEWFDYSESEDEDDDEDGEFEFGGGPIRDPEVLGPHEDSRSEALDELVGASLTIDGVITAAARAGLGPSRGLRLTLEHWIDARGDSAEGFDEEADDSCVVTTVSPDRRDTYEFEASPWTGNEGGDATQWYHQAALVVIPRDSWLRE